uniref:AAA+ ATPase domain-containing protein n=2 Tax=Timema TaxID=61471 RepID=A0A7R8VPI0_TIMDO|nr:unnamed protein product [Timema douglasi]
MPWFSLVTPKCLLAQLPLNTFKPHHIGVKVTPHTRCRLKLLKLERIKDYLLMEEEFIRNQERLKPQEEKIEEERSKVDDLRGTPMSVGTLEEIIDDNHAIVSTSVGSEHYVSILSFVDKDQLEPGCSVLLNHKVHAVVGVLSDDTDPMVTVMKLEKAPQETYADIGGKFHTSHIVCTYIEVRLSIRIASGTGMIGFEYSITIFYMAKELSWQRESRWEAKELSRQRESWWEAKELSWQRELQWEAKELSWQRESRWEAKELSRQRESWWEAEEQSRQCESRWEVRDSCRRIGSDDENALSKMTTIYLMLFAMWFTRVGSPVLKTAPEITVLYILHYCLALSNGENSGFPLVRENGRDSVHHASQWRALALCTEVESSRTAQRTWAAVSIRRANCERWRCVLRWSRHGRLREHGLGEGGGVPGSRGGLDTQIQEIKESVELPLTHPEYYEEMGIKPPKGVILYGPPGTGKTLLAKAVANQTSATFLRVVGSELIQKYLGDGPKLVRELFRVAEEHAPSIVFIDEIDAVGTKRYDSNSGGEREIQRTMLELLNQLDGFDSRGDVKVVMATNRIETLDPALIRPGRIDRKIEFPLPDEKTKRRIFNIHTSRMTLAEDVNLTELIMSKDDLSGADIKAICTEAGLMALRERRMKVNNEDFRKSKESVLYRKKEGTPEGLYL